MQLKDLKLKNMQGRKIKANTFDLASIHLTRLEVRKIQMAINNHKDNNKTLVKVSDRLHLDFIGWNNKDFFDVLLCKTSKAIKLAKQQVKLVGNRPDRENSLQQAEILIKIRNAKTETIKKCYVSRLEELQAKGNLKVKFANYEE